MTRLTMCAAVVAMMAQAAAAQDFYGAEGGYSDAGHGGGEYLGAGSVGSSEPLFPYDDQEPWKHGYLQYMPYYGGYHSGRPYNYHHVFSQTQTSVGWGLPHGLPYSQQWWHQYEGMADPGRAQTEPNGYYGYAPQSTNGQWVQTPRIVPMPSAANGGMHYVPAAIAPVEFQRPLPAPGVNPVIAPQQSRELRDYLIY
ncbi:MAG: hypothetical protein R3B90_13635 [Planctomycetaceae bacterium]